MRSTIRKGTIAFWVFIWLLVGGALVAAQDCPVPLTDRQRFGFVATSTDWPSNFDYATLKAGWVVDMPYRSHTSPPQGIDRFLLIRVHSGYQVNENVLGPLIDANPGVIWAIGNEPDSIYQDDIMPDDYARIYHDLYFFIKSRDRSSQVSPGGIVQPTSLRLKWLDHVLAAYRSRYGSEMPVDLWNIHNAILNEVSCNYDPGNCWGAGIPPGLDDLYGEIRTIDDNDNMTMFRDQIWAFRLWMSENGYGGLPLIVSEYGILMPEEYGFDAERVAAFMDATFDFFQTATDDKLGDPNDGYRLVQRWAWFSLDVQPFDPDTGVGFNGNLFDPETKTITAHGQNYASHTAAFPPLSYTDLGIRTLWAWPTSDLASSTQTISRTVEVQIGNLGTQDAGGFRVVLDYTGPVSGQLEHTLGGLDMFASQILTFSLTNLEPGSYHVSVSLDPDGQVTETRTCNNEASLTVLAPTHRIYMPLVLNRASGLATSLSARPGVSPPEPLAVSPLQPTDVTSGFHEFDLPANGSYPAQLVLDDQGIVWVSLRDGNKIARFDPQTEIWQEYAIPTADSQPWGLALDGAGNLWFAETAANQIGKMVMATGTFTEYAIPTPNSEPWEVTLGGDGMIWFTEKAGNKIARLDPATGTVTEYPLPTPNAEPTGIVSLGSYLWFTESAASKFGRIKTSNGVIYEWGTPTSDSAPQDIAATSDGTIWLTERQANQLGVAKISTLWMLFEISLRTNNSEPYGIAIGDDAVWFAQMAGNRIGHYSDSVPPDEYWLPTAHGQPTDVQVDGDGCAWYTAPGSNRIGRLCLPVNYEHLYLPLVIRD